MVKRNTNIEQPLHGISGYGTGSVSLKLDYKNEWTQVNKKSYGLQKGGHIGMA